MAEHATGGPELEDPQQAERDLTAITPTRQTAIAGGVVIGVGVFTTLLAVQTSSVWVMEGLLLVRWDGERLSTTVHAQGFARFAGGVGVFLAALSALMLLTKIVQRAPH
jgi:hypothetical protein